MTSTAGAVAKDERLHLVSSALKAYENFPQEKIVFQDIFAVFRNPAAFAALASLAQDYAKSVQQEIDVIVGLDSRGFLFGPLMALAVSKPFVPIRKKGKLPGDCVSECYSLEYGQAEVELQREALQPGARVLLVDDLLATGGTLAAACQLVEKCGATVVSCWVAIELTELAGRQKVGTEIVSLLKK